MYKFTSHLTNTKLVLVRKHLDGSCAALVVLRTPRRHATGAHFDPEKCPPRSSGTPKSRKLLYGTIGATILTGAAVVYAKNNPETRNWIENNVPLANDLIALVYQENTTYWKFSVNQFNKAATAISHFMFGKEGVSPMDFKTRPEQNIDADAKEKFAPKTYELPPPPFEPLYKEELVLETPEVHTPATVIKTDKCEPSPPPVIRITKDMVELEQEMHENTRAAVDNFKAATKHCMAYNKAVCKIVENSLDDLDKTDFSAVKQTGTKRMETEELAKSSAAKARLAIDALERLLAAGAPAPAESAAAARRHIRQFRADLAAAEAAYSAEKEKCVLSDKYWNKVEEARNAYKAELQMLFPGIDLSQRKLDIKGDTDLLLLYTLKQVAYLQNEIAELQTVREQKMNRAIECHDEKQIIEAKVEDMIKKEQIEKDKELNKKVLEIQAEAARNLKEQLKKQFEIQQEVMQAALNRKEKEVLDKFNRAVSEQVEKERIIFKRELAAMAGKLQAIEHTLKKRAKAEAEARRSQALWAAAEALLAATRRGPRRAPLAAELRALEDAGKDDKLVQTVLKGIPKEAREQGIVTEQALREKFDVMEQTAAKVALVGRNGAGLPIYFLSWLQSKLLFPKLSEIPKDELDNLPTDFASLDTFDIIQRARYYMDHGDLPAALRYVNLLQGAPRAAAAPWLRSAREHLEVRQAAEAVMAHASVSGLLYS